MKQVIHADNSGIMSSAFVVMNKILKYVEQSLDSDVFDESGFTAENFKVSKNRFARLVKMLSDSGYIEGVEVFDNGEPDPFTPKNIPRFQIRLGENASITVKGLQFLAENTAWARAYNVVKEVKGFVR